MALYKSVTHGLLLTLGIVGCGVAYEGYEARKTYFWGNIISLENHHELQRDAQLDDNKKAQLEEKLALSLESQSMQSIEDAIDFSLTFTAQSLEFRFRSYLLGERGHNYFTFTRDVKKTDCVDYAFLFDRTFDYVVGRTGIEAEARIMRSENALLFGHRVDNHDWNLVKDLSAGKAYFIDATAYDYFMPADIQPIIGNK